MYFTLYFEKLLQITFVNEVGKFDLEITTFQMAVLFAWNQRPKERVTFESLRLACELPDAELKRTLFVSGNHLGFSWMEKWLKYKVLRTNVNFTLLFFEDA